VQPVNETEDGDGDYAEEMLELPEANEQENPASPAPVMGGSHDLAPSTVTLSGLLNAIDGVSSQEGCVLIAST
jgi:chaperone BCS1